MSRVFLFFLSLAHALFVYAVEVHSDALDRFGLVRRTHLVTCD